MLLIHNEAINTNLIRFSRLNVFWHTLFSIISACSNGCFICCCIVCHGWWFVKVVWWRRVNKTWIGSSYLTSCGYTANWWNWWLFSYGWWELSIIRGITGLRLRNLWPKKLCQTSNYIWFLPFNLIIEGHSIISNSMLLPVPDWAYDVSYVWMQGL